MGAMWLGFGEIDSQEMAVGQPNPPEYRAEEASYTFRQG